MCIKKKDLKRCLKVFIFSISSYIFIHNNYSLKIKSIGLVPKILRFGPGGALMIVSYEEIYKFLKGNF